MSSVNRILPRRAPAAASRSRRRGRIPSARSALRLGLAVAGSGAMAATLTLTAGTAQASPAVPHYFFHTINNQRDVTFNQLLGINNHGKIAGYFGSGAQGHPNKGYEISPPYGQGNFRNENFPGSVQTQVTGLNTSKVTVGFFSTQNTASGANNNFGFYAVNGRHFHKVDFPTRHPASPPVDQLLGVNNNDVAVGFFQKASGNTQGYLYDIRSRRYLTVPIPGGVSTVATAINDPGSIAGFFTNAAGVTKGFLFRHTGQLIILQHPHATTTQAFGVNNSGEVVGLYVLGSGSSATTHGFTWTRNHGFKTVDDPQGRGTTTVNGINNAGVLVGFYTDSRGNTDGMLAVPIP